MLMVWEFTLFRKITVSIACWHFGCFCFQFFTEILSNTVLLELFSKMACIIMNSIKESYLLRHVCIIFFKQIHYGFQRITLYLQQEIDFI